MPILKFPCWRYHRTAAPRLIDTPEQEQALGPDWADTPAAFFGSVVVPPPVSGVPGDDDPREAVQPVEDAPAPKKGRKR